MAGPEHVDVAVEAEDAGQKLGAEAVHHRHDDDQHRHGQHDADEGDAGDQRHAALLALGAQVAAAMDRSRLEKGRRAGEGLSVKAGRSVGAGDQDGFHRRLRR